MVTQVQIAREVGLDVSSVNKILNRMPGPVFKDCTIKAVRRTARRLGWKPWCSLCRRADAELFPAPRGKRVCALCVEALIVEYNKGASFCQACAVTATKQLSAPPIEIQPTGILEAHEARRKAVTLG